MWKRNNTVTARMPLGYEFEFVPVEVNVLMSTLLPELGRVARLEWTLFRNAGPVLEGTTTLDMSLKDPWEEIFIFGRNKAVEHYNSVVDAEAFPFTEVGKVYSLPVEMEISDYAAEHELLRVKPPAAT